MMSDDVIHFMLHRAIINDGTGHPERCKIAQDARARNSFAATSYAANRWLAVAQEGAARYERQFGSPGASCFTARDILCTAAELADYYDRHVQELEDDPPRAR